MLSSLIEASLGNRFLVIALVCLMAVAGAVAAMNIPIDALPDMTNVQVQVVTVAGVLSPLEVERLVTYPIESAMNGLPRVVEIRSVSRFGLSSVTVVFEEGVDVFRARQLISERLPEVREKLRGSGDPQLGPLSTALGEILQFEIRGEGWTPMQLRTLLDWEIAPLLRGTRGVTEVNVHGGYAKTFEFQIDPNQMASYSVALAEVFEAIERNNSSAGGGYVVHHGEQQFIRGQSLLKTAEEIEQVVVRSSSSGVPILLRDLGKVQIAPLLRQGAVSRDGRGEAVTGMAIMVLGENSRRVVEHVKQRLTEIEPTLPKGVSIEVIYDRAGLINRTLSTVMHNLLEGGALVIVILFLMLGSLRAGLIVAIAIPCSMLCAANLMYLTGVTASLMSLGAIDFGLIVDSSVIMVENCMRRLANSDGRSRMQIIHEAALEVRKPTMFGELIIAVVYLPILSMQATEGKLFRPMALTVLFALAGSLVLSLTLMPVLASLALTRDDHAEENWLMRGVQRLYRPWLNLAMARPVGTALVAAGLVAASIPIGLGLGGEFLPRLDEGDLLIQAYRLPSASLEDAGVVTAQIEKWIGAHPEVKTVFCKTGRPEIANDVMGVHETDVWVILKPPHEWPSASSYDQLVGDLSRDLNAHVPGVAFSFTQPIEMRVNELVAGVKSDVAALLYGDDLEILNRKSREIERVLREVPGAVDVKADYQAGLPTLRVRPRPEQLALHGIDAQEVMETVASLGGRQVGLVYDGRARFPITVRLPREWREDSRLLEQVPVRKIGGRQAPLGDLADITMEETPPSIQHDATRRRTFVQANVRGRDVVSFVQEARAAVERNVKLPVGYSVRWGGEFEHLQSAVRRLTVITPLALLMIFLLLYSSLGSAILALLIFLAVPVSASGGIAALALRGMPFSVSAGIGFIALFGVAVLNGLVWVSAAERLRAAGAPAREAAYQAALVRLRPILMTALVASFGFVPMALSTSAGAEIQRPLATVVIGGLVTSTLMTGLLLPAIYQWFAARSGRSEAAHDPARDAPQGALSSSA